LDTQTTQTQCKVTDW